MGLFDKVKKAIGGGSSAAPSKGTGGAGSQGKQGGQGQGGNRQGAAAGKERAQGQGGNRQGGSGGQGGGNRSRGGNRNRPGSERAEGGDREGGQGQGGSGGGSSSRRRGSRGGRGRGGQGGQGNQQGQAAQQRAEGEARAQGGQRQQGQGQEQNQGQGGEGSSGSSSSSRRRRRGGRGRGSGSGSGSSGSGTTRTVTRSNAAELKEQQGESGGSGGGRNRSGGRAQGGKKSGSRSRSGGGRRRERTRRGSASSGSHRRVLDANERPKDPVKKQILINASDPNEIRVAIREQQKVVEVYVERKGKRSLAGNIYKGRVQNVLRGMEAAFVDIGLERNGFLYVDEITPAAADSDQVMKVSMVTEVETAAAPSGALETADEAAIAAAVDGVTATLSVPGTPAEAMAQAAADNDETLDIGDAMEEQDREAAEQAEADAAAKAAGEEKPKEEKSKGRGRARIQNKKKIQELLKPGQEILCQVVKDPMGTKGSRLTTQYSLAGRYLVYVPDGEGLGVSRRLEEAERNRLRDIVKQFELPWGGGLIVRTAAEGALEEDIAKDLQLLLRLHEQLMDKAGQARAPKLLYNEADLSLRIIRDLMNDEVEEVLVDDDRQYQRIMNYLKRTSPILAERVRMHDGQRPVFESYGVEEAIRSTLSKRADLVSGGYLIIDKTEAFHVIDVNTGRNVGTASLEETITKTNMEAAEEVVRQLRLRDLGGIIVIDFIDMNLMKNRDMVLEHFRKELSKDRTKTYLVEISPLGLVEMTRQNVSEGVREILTSTCRSCEGRGVQVSAETHAIEVERAVVDLAAGLGDGVDAVAIETQPDVARVLAGTQGKQVELNKRTGKFVRVFPDPDLQPNTFAVRATGEVAKVEQLAEPLLRGTKHKVVIDRVDPACEEDGLAVVDGVLVTVIGAGSLVGEERTILIAACAGGRAFATLVKPARRRRRRGGRGRRKATAAVGGATSTLDDEAEDSGNEDEDGDDEGSEFDDDDFEEGEDDGGAEAQDDEREPDDERTEIPQRLVMLEEDDPDAPEVDDDGDDEADDEFDEDDEDEDEADDEFDDDDDSDSRGGDEDDDSGSPEGPDDAGADSQDEDSAADDEEDAGSEDGEDASIDMASIAADDEDDRPIARRAVVADDRDEPSIDPDGGDDLLAARGVRVPAGATSAASGSTSGSGASARQGATGGSGSGSGSGSEGGGQRRRRRGSRGGRNRNRSGANRPSGGGSGGDGTGGGERSGAGGSGAGSTDG